MEQMGCSAFLVTTTEGCARIVEKSSVELKKIDNKQLSAGLVSPMAQRQPRKCEEDMGRLSAINLQHRFAAMERRNLPHVPSHQVQDAFLKASYLSASNSGSGRSCSDLATSYQCRSLLSCEFHRIPLENQLRSVGKRCFFGHMGRCLEISHATKSTCCQTHPKLKETPWPKVLSPSPP